MKQSPIIFPWLGADTLTQKIQEQCGYSLGCMSRHQFPDGETLITIHSEVHDRSVLFVVHLQDPNPSILPILFASETARSLGATDITLVAPYLAYMRQDKVFAKGQGITSQYFAKLLSGYFDRIITIDPHLHRWHTLSAIYQVPTVVLHASDKIAGWIVHNVANPILIGPDMESAQWVRAIAKKVGSPFLILEKKRSGDKAIEVSIPHIEQYRDHVPVLIDDIISTAMSMIGAIKHLHDLKMPKPVCIGVHAVFAGDAYQALLASGIDRVVTCNTIPHITNAIDISSEISQRLGVYHAND